MNQQPKEFTTTEETSLRDFIEAIKVLFKTCGFNPQHEDPRISSAETRWDFVLKVVPHGCDQRDYVLTPIKPFLEIETTELTETSGGFAFHYEEFVAIISITLRSYDHPIVAITFWGPSTQN